MRIVGFDPGLQRTGYAILQGTGRTPTLVEAGVLRVATDLSLPQRLDRLYSMIQEVLEEATANSVAVEELYSHYERPRTAILMGHARGVLLLAAAKAGVPVTSYSATRVKKTTTGSGRASKQQMQAAIQAEFGLSAPPEPPDVADALAIALCHFHAHRLGR